MPEALATTPDGILLVLAVMVPFAGLLVAFAFGGRNAQRIALLTILATAGVAAAITAVALRGDTTLVYLLGGWAPPLGIALRADPLALVMIPAIALVIVGIALYACADFGTPAGLRESRAPLVFWVLLLAIWGALNLVFLSGDLFTLYVALELLTFGAVPFVALDGKPETLRAALRYALYALLGSVFYLLGTVLLYGAYGTLDIALLRELVRPEPVVLVAAALMTVGLLAKTALFPLHLWLPPAHGGAPPAASAVLSGLVIKGSWFLVVRLWFDVLPGVVTWSSAQLVAAFGAAAILVGNVVALRQERLKLLVAYSTVAQIGYLFLMFPLAFDATAGALAPGGAQAGGMLQAISHALAKAAMFMAAGLIYKALSHDRIGEMAGIGRALPLTVLTFALAGLALMGLPPSGAFAAKKLLLDAAADSGQWWWGAVLDVGGLLTASYVVLVLSHALAPTATPIALRAPVSRLGELSALALAVCSLALGLAALGPAPFDALPDPLVAKEFGAALVTLLGGAVLALALGLRLPPVRGGGALGAGLRRATVAVGAGFVRADGVLRQWPVATLALILAALAFGVAFAPRS
ncbi:MAG TPA: proton-conducting transporter membrane subunit [Pseudomonadota bacterium]|nr:proton-conducting transporter membrane subunit [Pseudomonadota bacterium]